MTLAKDHTIAEVSEALEMSTRWVRDQIAAGASHQRYGNRIRFTDAQVEALKARFTKSPVEAGITTSRRGRRAS